MKKKFGKLIMAVSVICAVGMFFSSCNDYVSDVNAELKGQIADLNADMSADLADLQTALENAINECKDNCAAKHIELEKADQENSDSIAALLQDVADLDGRIEVLEDAKIKVDSTLHALDSIQDIHADSIANFYKTYATIAYVDAALNDSVSQLRSEINTKFAAAMAAVFGVEAQVSLHTAEIKSLKEELAKIKSCNCDTAAMWAKINANENNIKDLQSQIVNLDLKVEDALSKIATHDTLITNLQDADELLKQDIADLNTAVSEIRAALTDLEKRMSIVENRLNKRISSVVVNGAYSPVVGYFNLPTGMRSNILAAYYNVIASPANELKFPTVRTANYLDPSVAFTDAEAAMLGFAETSYGAKNDVLVGTEGNAGTLYLTINPNDVDTTGIKLSLKNSIGEESAMLLGPLVKSDKKLNFGYTRAANNGFYEVAATMQADAVDKAQIRIELEDLKSVVKDFVSVGNGVNLSNAITTLYSAVNDIADAYAVEATYTDSLGEHQVYSDYALAAVAIKPLSYNTLMGLNVESFPGMDRVSNLVNKVFNKVGTINIPDLGLNNLSGKLDSISFAGVIGDSISFGLKFKDTITRDIHFYKVIQVPVPLKDINLTIPVPSQTITTTDAFGNPINIDIPATTINHNVPASDLMSGTPTVTIDTTFSVTIDIDIDRTISIPSEEILSNLGGTLNDVDDYLKDVNEMLKGFTGKIESVENELNSTISKVENKLNEYLDKLNNKLCSVLNSINSKLQPTMLVSTTDGFSLLSSFKGAPSQVNAAAFTLVPTSYTAEILAPAFKKYIAVTAAYDSNGNLDNNVAMAANTGDLNTVLDGHTRAIAFNGQSGYTYEITYSAVDFSGYISNTKYYVEVK